MEESEEKALIQKAQNGDTASFEALINARYETIFRMAFKWCGNRADAEDIAQEACIKLARGLESYRFDSAFTSWLYRLVINTAMDWQRKNKRHAVTSEGLDMARIESSSEDQLYAAQVLEEVNRLPEGEKEAVMLVLDQGLSHKEAAKLLGCKESTVSWRIHEARKKLGAAFAKEQSYG